MDDLIKILEERRRQKLINEVDFYFALSWIKKKCINTKINKEEAESIVNGMILIIHNERNVYN